MQNQRTIRTAGQEFMPLMQQAMAAARAHEGATAPNPPVGCLLLDAFGNTLAVAGHAGAGQPHAEAAAIAKAKADGFDDVIHTVVVTLEPCNHQGRTPPCTEAILKTPARRVVFGLADPNPHVAGGGAQRLLDAGLIVDRYNGMDPELRRLIGPFTKRTIHGLPWVTVKQALNHTGSMIPPAGQKTFTSQGSLQLAHELRRRADAIATGSGTILADDPQFTVRHVADVPGKRRPLILFDRRRRVPDSYRRDAATRGFDVVFADDIGKALRAAAAHGAMEVLFEAGPQLTAQILATPFWDEHVLIQQREGQDDHIEINVNRKGFAADVFRDH